MPVTTLANVAGSIPAEVLKNLSRNGSYRGLAEIVPIETEKILLADVHDNLSTGESSIGRLQNFKGRKADERCPNLVGFCSDGDM